MLSSRRKMEAGLESLVFERKQTRNREAQPPLRRESTFQMEYKMRSKRTKLKTKKIKEQRNVETFCGL